MKPLRFDPQALPVLRTDADLPPLEPQRLEPDFLRRQFRGSPAWHPEFTAERRFEDGRAPADAAVLVPLVVRPRQGLQVLLTRRTERLAAHPGQVAFPGGRTEPTDPGPVHTALREAQEEIGLPPHVVEVLGPLPIYATVTNFRVTPVVALVHEPPPLRPDPHEVDEIFEVPLAFLMTPAHHRRHSVGEGDEQREFLSMPYPAVPAGAAVPAGTRFVWGATAAMLRNLYRFLRADAA